jgi:putative DNA primase/helicase
MSAEKLLERMTGVKSTGPNRWVACCSWHGGRRASLSIRLFDDGRIGIHCFAGCSADNVLAAVGLTFRDLFPDSENHSADWAGHRHAKFPSEVSQPVDRSSQVARQYDDYAAALFDQAVPVRSDNIGGRYLRARKCVLPPADGDLRLHPALKHPPTGYVGPALIGRVTHAITGEPQTIHRTWITADGTKPVDPARMLLGGYRKAGGVIRLWPDDAVTHGLGIAEGIETGLSLAYAIQPVWACIDAGNLKLFPVLAGVEALAIAVDNDPAGMSGASECAARWHTAGREVRLVKSDELGADLNDLVRAA